MMLMSFDIPKEMQESYLSRRMIELDELTSYLAKKAWKAIETVGHQIKGNAESYGFPKLSVIGKDLENAARLQDERVIAEVLEKLKLQVLEEKKIL